MLNLFLHENEFIGIRKNNITNKNLIKMTYQSEI